MKTLSLLSVFVCVTVLQLQTSSNNWHIYDINSPVTQVVENLPAMQETQEMWVRYLGQEDPLEKEMATHSSVLAWEIPWTKEPGRLQSIGSQRAGPNWASCTQDVILIISRIRIIKNIVLYMLNNNERNPIYLFNLTISSVKFCENFLYCFFDNFSFVLFLYGTYLQFGFSFLFPFSSFKNLALILRISSLYFLKHLLLLYFHIYNFQESFTVH